jgi:hypothetical protein
MNFNEPWRISHVNVEYSLYELPFTLLHRLNIHIYGDYYVVLDVYKGDSSANKNITYNWDNIHNTLIVEDVYNVSILSLTLSTYGFIWPYQRSCLIQVSDSINYRNIILNDQKSEIIKQPENIEILQNTKVPKNKTLSINTTIFIEFISVMIYILEDIMILIYICLYIISQYYMIFIISWVILKLLFLLN